MKIVTLGEIMLRLTPSGYDRFVQTASFEAHYGGARKLGRRRSFREQSARS